MCPKNRPGKIGRPQGSRHRRSTMRVDAVYVRKSTSPQEEQSQIDAIKDYLDRTGVGVAPEHWFTDTGSRHRPEDRPDFQKMLALVEQKKVRRVYVWKQDRIVSG